MRKIGLFVLIIAVLVIGNHLSSQQIVLTEPKTAANKSFWPVTPYIQNKAPSNLARSPASLVPNKTHYVTNVDQAFVPDLSIPLDHGHILAKDMGAVSKAEYDPKMGELISEDKNFSYYKKQDQDEASPVAYNPSKKRFRPISSVLHLTDVGEDLRQEILAAGYEEYYFDQKLKLLFIKSSPTEVLALYQNFKNKGLNAQLEVLPLPIIAH